MGILSLIGSFFGLVSSGVTGFFNVKQAQAQTIQDSIDCLGKLNDSDTQSQIAAARAISAIVTQGSPLERLWRPLLMCVFIGIILSYWFGHVPPRFNDPMSPMMQQILDMIKIGIGGYIPCRTIDKLVSQINLGSILKTFTNGKIK